MYRNGIAVVYHHLSYCHLYRLLLGFYIIICVVCILEYADSCVTSTVSLWLLCMSSVFLCSPIHAVVYSQVSYHNQLLFVLISNCCTGNTVAVHLNITYIIWLVARHYNLYTYTQVLLIYTVHGLFLRLLIFANGRNSLQKNFHALFFFTNPSWGELLFKREQRAGFLRCGGYKRWLRSWSPATVCQNRHLQSFTHENKAWLINIHIH